MLTILLTVDTPANDFTEKYGHFINTILKYEKDFEVIFLAKNDYPDKAAFRLLASNLPNHQYVTLNERNNKNELILLGLAQSRGDDIMLCTWDTNIIVIDEILQKRKDGCDLIFVKNKKSKLRNFFEALGKGAYNFGTMLTKHNFDMFAETDVQLLDGRIANLICSVPDQCFELRVTNSYKQLKQGIVESEQIYEGKTKQSNSSPLFKLGVVCFFYIIALLSIIIITPIFNYGIYTWWSLLIIAALLIFGIVGDIAVTKHIYKNRNANPVRVNQNGEPVFYVEEYIAEGQGQTDIEYTEIEQQVNTLFKSESHAKSQAASSAVSIINSTKKSGNKNMKASSTSKKTIKAGTKKATSKKPAAKAVKTEKKPAKAISKKAATKAEKKPASAKATKKPATTKTGTKTQTKKVAKKESPAAKTVKKVIKKVATATKTKKTTEKKPTTKKPAAKKPLLKLRKKASKKEIIYEQN